MPRAWPQSRQGAARLGRAAARVEPRRDGGRHRTECRRRLRARARSTRSRRRPDSVPPGRQSISRDAEHGRHRRLQRRDAQARRWNWARSRATCGCSRWVRAPASSEIALPAVQPGSSIMPGKVNPSVPEMVNQVCFQVIGCDTTVAIAGEAGQLELNVMMPVIAWNALHAAAILTTAQHAFRERTVVGLEADAARRRNCWIAAPPSRPRSARTSVTP